MKIPDKIKNQLLKIQNVNGLFYGEMTKEGEPRGKGIIVTVSKKVDPLKLNKNAMIPKTLGAFDVDVIEVGKIKALVADRTVEYRPFPMGVSVGHKDITAGTAGCLVHRNGTPFLLSNNHVLANVNCAKIGDEILQPGPYDGGTIEQHTIGHLSEYVKISFAGCSISKWITKLFNGIAKFFGSNTTFSYDTVSVKGAGNLVDCALAELIEKDIAAPGIIDLGQITSVGTAEVGDTVWKSGRTTQVQSGPVVATNYTTQVDMGEQGIATFTDQILIAKEGFSDGGDSGSAIVKKVFNDEFAIVGLLFAGSEKVTIGNKIQNVFDQLGVTF